MSPARVAAVIVAALVAGAVVVALELTSDHRDAKVVWAVFGPGGRLELHRHGPVRDAAAAGGAASAC